MGNRIQIHGSQLSANHRKVMAVAHHLGIEVDDEPVNVYQGDGQSESFLRLNRLGQIPVLEDGETVLRESNAILMYLAEKHSDASLLGKDVTQRALTNQWLFWESSQWQPILSEVMGPSVGHKLLPDVLPKPINEPAWHQDSCVRQLRFLEASLTHTWLLGDALSLADFSVGAMTTYFKTSGFPFDDYPMITRWYSQLNEQTPWQETLDPLWA